MTGGGWPRGGEASRLPAFALSLLLTSQTLAKRCAQPPKAYCPGAFRRLHARGPAARESIARGALVPLGVPVPCNSHLRVRAPSSRARASAPRGYFAPHTGAVSRGGVVTRRIPELI